MRRAQTAVPAVLLTIMALIIWYVLWIYPEQRYELLFGDQNSNVVTQTPSDNVIFSTVIGEIGQSSGELLDTQIVSDLSVSYPATRDVISSYVSQIFSSNIIASEHKTVDLYNSDADIFNVEVLTNSVVGTPKLKVLLNDSLVYETELISGSRTSIDIPKSSIESEGGILRIICDFNGFQFWTTQQCGFDELNVYEYVFAPIDPSDSDVFYLTPSSENSELVELSFTPTNTNNYPVNLLINNNSVYSGKFDSNEEVVLSLEGEYLNLGIDNIISLVASEGADYILSDISMNFYSVPSGLAAKYVAFDVDSEVLEDENYLTFNFELTGIVEPGDLIVEIINSGATYVIPYSDLILGDNLLEVYTNDLQSNGNNVRISSNNGRLIIGDFEIN